MGLTAGGDLLDAASLTVPAILIAYWGVGR